MDPGHKARKNPSDNADLGFQAVGPGYRYNAEMWNAERKVRNARAEWCVECGRRKACNQGVLYCLFFAPVGSINFFYQIVTMTVIF